ncbi:MAG: hypothetical protein HRT82_13985 [Henriciella sp.]|nr:hypothetical protein [Henriciella sp.]
MDRNSLTLFAVLLLSVSNLFVGISTQNKVLILASAAISAALALVYIGKELLQKRLEASEDPGEAVAISQSPSRPARFPLWVFVVILFVILPALLWFLQLTAQ